MKIDKKYILNIFLLVGIILMISLAAAVYTRSSPQYVYPGSSFSPGGSIYNPSFDSVMCSEVGQDFIIQIAPEGCQSMPVRSDLLAEQEVPVFCPLALTKLNPLIKVEAIDAMYIRGQLPPEVSSVGFYPSRSALGTRQEQINSPVLDNIGYATIMLRRQPKESELMNCEEDPLVGGEVCWVEGNLTATIKYDIENAFGVGRAEFYLPELSDRDWDDRYRQYSFWEGRAYLRAESIDEDGARVSIYTGENKELTTLSLDKGETSEKIYIPELGYCLASFRVKVNDIEDPKMRAKLKINEDYIEIAEDERFLEEKCWATSIRPQGFTQSIEITCKEDEERSKFELIISPKFEINNGTNILELAIGDLISGSKDDEERIFLGYAGETDQGIKYIIPVSSPSKNSEEFKKTLIYNKLPNVVSTLDFESGNLVLDFAKTITSLGFSALASAAGSIISGDEPIGIIYEHGVKDPLYFNVYSSTNIVFTGFASPVNAKLDAEEDSHVREYYLKALEDYDKILNDFENSSYPSDDELSLGDRALAMKIILLNKLDQKQELVGFCSILKEKYSSANAEDMILNEALQTCNNEYKLASSNASKKQVVLNGKVKEISFEGIYEPSREDYSAVVLVDGEERIITKGIKYPLKDKDYFELVKLNKESVEIRFSLKKSFTQSLATTFSVNTKTIKLNDYEVIVGENTYTIGVQEINLKKFARVSILPDINYAETEGDFKFKIGIEKRSIQLTPEKTQERINQVDNLVNSLQDVSGKMSTAVESMKKACLATGGLLTAKNAYANSKGRGTARSTIMRGDNGWYEICVDRQNSPNYDYSSEEDCLLENNAQIEGHIDNLTQVIQDQSKFIVDLEKDSFIDIELGSKSINQTLFGIKYISFIKNQLDELNNKGITSIPNPNYRGQGDVVEISISEMKGLLSSSALKENKYDVEDLKEIELYARLLNSTSDIYLMNLSKTRLYSSFEIIKKNSAEFKQRSDWASSLGVSSTNVLAIQTKKDVEKFPYSGVVNGDYLSGISENTPIQHITTEDGKQYTVVLEEAGALNILNIKRLSIPELYGDKGIPEVYDSNRILITENLPDKFEKITFVRYDSLSYKNQYKNPLVRYYETGVYARNPAIVPFDLENGWYAAIKSTIPTLGKIRTYDDSARVHSYYLCNVGKDNLEEFFSGIGDDTCKLFVVGEPNYPDDYFPGLSSSEVSKLVRRSVTAIEEASKQYNQDVVRISGVDIPIKKGKPAVDLPEIKCQDFMSAKDCQIMFNVCDPVTCPSSRCDFGGRYPVENVIQSGIIGSVALCLPNWNEGIYVPVCLSGVNAGLESLIQVGEGYSQCLQTSLDKGETVGICDEVHSVYACEFLWSQATPLLEVAATKLSEKTHYGGGEYFSFLEMFDTAQQSANFFTQYYAEDSYKAFKARSTSDIGTSFCKAFKYLSFPEGMNLIDSITQPDSPNQFSGHFDEIPLNTITNPPTSHYKVFYHIYAGGDSAAYYRVYLKEGTESSFYNDPIGIELVDSGYIPLGESVIETKDFIAPAGFQTMCVNVNGIEKCGFKQISTSFSVEYMEDIYLSQQGKEKNIKTEKECISGSVNALSLLNPNIQSGVNDLISPEIYNQGLIRVCSTDDPGKGTDTLAGENARWQEVGYCDDPKLKCWIDKQSVKDVIYATNLENKTLEELNEDQQKILESEGTITKAFGDEIKKIEDEESPSIKINLLNNLFDKVHFNNQKAYLYLKRGEVYTVLALKEYLTSPESEKENVDFEIKPFSETEEQEIFESYLTRNNLKLNDKGEIVNEDGELVEIEQEILNLKDEHQSQINEEIPIEETSSEEIFVEETLPGETFVETEKIYSPEEATERQLKLIELSKKDFKEYCDTAAEVAGDFYCARYVTQAFDYWFGYGRSYFLGVRGDAWSFNESMLNSGGKIIIPNEDYSNLREGDLIGFKRKWDNSKYKEQAYTHVGFYLGKFDDKNAVAHKLGNTPKISTIESILQMEGGVRTISWLNTILPGSYFDIKEKWNIAVVIRPDQNKLYIPLETYIEQKELEEEEYIVQSDDTLFKVASKYYPDNLSEINILMWLIREGNNIISNELVVGEAIKIYIPKKEVIVEGEIEGEISKEPIVVQPIVDSSDGYGAVVRVLRGFRRSTEESNAWAKAITESLESNNLETNVMNSLVVLTFMERESSIKAIPATRLVEECDSAAFFDDPKVSLGCTTFKSEIEKASVDDGVVDEKEYVNMKKFLVSLNSLRPLYSAGSMQVAVPTALQLVRSGENIDEDNIYDVLLTVEGGAEFGVRYVKSLIDLYVPKNGDLKDNLAFIFSDYNSGLGSSRNAAFQDQINTLNTNLGNPELELSLDGKLGPASIKAIENIVGKDVHETLKLNNNELIIGSTSPVLEDRTFYIEIKQKYYSLTGKTPDYAIVPELEYSAAGITSKLSVRKYTSGSFCFMVGQCVKAESCPTDLLTEVIENILEEYEKAWGKECSNLKSYISSNPEQYNSLGFS